MNLADKACTVCGEPGATEVLFGVRLCVRCASDETGEGAHEAAEKADLDGAVLRRELGILLEEIDLLPVEEVTENFLRGLDAKGLQTQKARQAVKDSLRGMN